MNWTDLLQHYGYFAIFIGTLLEGETVLILGAYAVHQHIFHFWILIMVAMAGGFIGDQFYYQIGMRYGQKIIQSKPQLAQKFAQASIIIDHYPVLTILLMRFAWGLRTILPISIGIKAYPLWKYMLINLLACLIWAFVVVSVGLQISYWLHVFWAKILPYHHDLYIILAVVACILLLRIMYAIVIRYKKMR
ncbi:DedA family protein [Acinetobacter sp. SM34]|uniref:DedA family protein n=1 Tax=Acinetobacter sp. SM34 TaxID=1301620 RepID=UPI001EDABD3D|nr:DedA family protein [Acinetobacter sp. SM34]MCG2608340.1 DedA family protein [Acinetobacter sp. SM34]